MLDNILFKDIAKRLNFDYIMWTENKLSTSHPFAIPALPKNAVIVMDNATFHKRHDIQRAIIDAGHLVEYLPAYSPDLNSIEYKWAQAKRKKRASGCDVDSLFSVHMM